MIRPKRNAASAGTECGAKNSAWQLKLKHKGHPLDVQRVDAGARFDMGQESAASNSCTKLTIDPDAPQRQRGAHR